MAVVKVNFLAPRPAMSNDFEPLTRRFQEQSQGSTVENIVPLTTDSHPLRGNTADAGDVEWMLFNLLSLGRSTCIS